MLWNRSLVMLDAETGSLWSHILGEAIEGKLKGKRLEAVPAEMTTWAAWRRTHPNTSVLHLSRTSRNFTNAFYRRRPAAFVFAWLVDGTPYHRRLDRLQKSPLANLTCDDAPLLLLFDPESTGARLFSRRVGDRVLDFEEAADGKLRDKQTGSTWDPVEGAALDGTLKGQRLKPEVGLMSFARAWETFHPKSQDK